MYFPHTDDDQKAMLERIGLKTPAELFDVIPAELRLRELLQLPPALTELELTSHMVDLAGRNDSCDRTICFLGGGCYDHFIPAVVDAVASRSEYYTAYTPYQAEVSQGTLQVGFEFQTLMCELTGLDVANASLYEGGTAVVEAALMAVAVAGRTGKILCSSSVHPEYRQSLATYLENLQTQLVLVDSKDGVADLDDLRKKLDDDCACMIVQSPNFFGRIEPVAQCANLAHEKGALLIQAFDPTSLGLLKKPADYGVDVAVAEGQSLGTPMSFGGPFLGVFACKSEHVRRIPGRVVGQTVDREGRRAFVLTLQTREQHIRREKATSNICTNQGLLALRASVYLSLLGPQGIQELSESCWHKAHYAARRLSQLPGAKLKFTGPFFKEFVLELPKPAEHYLPALLEAGFHAGVPLGKWFPEMDRCLLVAVTEKRTRTQIDALAEAWRKVL